MVGVCWPLSLSCLNPWFNNTTIPTINHKTSCHVPFTSDRRREDATHGGNHAGWEPHEHMHTQNCWNNMLNKGFELKYAHMWFNHHTQRKPTAFIHACIQHVHFISLTVNMVAEVKMGKITYLMKTLLRNQLRRCNDPPNHRIAFSLISQQHCHPRDGHDSPRNKGTSRLTHSQGYTKHTAKPIKLGLSGHQGVGKG